MKYNKEIFDLRLKMLNLKMMLKQDSSQKRDTSFFKKARKQIARIKTQESMLRKG